MTNYIDTHMHLNLLQAPGLQLNNARRSGIGAWVVPGTTCESWTDLMETVKTHADVYAAPGVHPQASARHRETHLGELRELLDHPKAVALGEVGLDRKINIPWQIQEAVFIQMVQLAREMNKPLLIHVRQSAERILELLHRHKADQLGGIFHAFSGSIETANKIIDMGFVLGIGGVVTFATAKRLPEVVVKVSAEALVLETDAPYMTPEPHRGRPNQPEYLPLIARKVAGLRGWTLEETARTTTANALRVLKLPLPENKQPEGDS